MLKEVITMLKTEQGIPTDEELQECLDLAKEKSNCVIVLQWYKKYSGWHELKFTEDIKIIEDCKNHMPKYYPV